MRHMPMLTRRRLFAGVAAAAMISVSGCSSVLTDIFGPSNATLEAAVVAMTAGSAGLTLVSGLIKAGVLKPGSTTLNSIMTVAGEIGAGFNGVQSAIDAGNSAAASALFEGATGIYAYLASLQADIAANPPAPAQAMAMHAALMKPKIVFTIPVIISLVEALFPAVQQAASTLWPLLQQVIGQLGGTSSTTTPTYTAANVDQANANYQANLTALKTQAAA